MGFADQLKKTAKAFLPHPPKTEPKHEWHSHPQKGDAVLLSTLRKRVDLESQRFTDLEVKAGLLLAIQTFLLLLLYGFRFDNAFLLAARVVSWLAVGSLFMAIWPRDVFIPDPGSPDSISRYRTYEAEEVRLRVLTNWKEHLFDFDYENSVKERRMRRSLALSLSSFILTAIGLGFTFAISRFPIC